MATVETIYLGDLRTEATHLQSGTKIMTDAPVDNHGKGEAFSPDRSRGYGVGKLYDDPDGHCSADAGPRTEGYQVDYYEDHECLAPSDWRDCDRCSFPDGFRSEAACYSRTCGNYLSGGSFAASRLQADDTLPLRRVRSVNRLKI